ncbi:patatin-like phospholipase family protein, partial [candidate division WOR-3 bacterium]|nr:patatin-like phospholipase family protein [candidate division WOR-3 bacterium]
SDLFRLTTRDGAYWGIRTDITHYGLADALDCPIDKTTKLASIQTRLKRLDSKTQECLINWGYAVCDAAMRKHVDTTLPIPTGFPYDKLLH